MANNKDKSGQAHHLSQNATYAVSRAYSQQRSYGLFNMDSVPRIPRKIPQKR